MVRNVHERLVPGPLADVGPLLDRLGGADDPLWPTPGWMPMVLDGPLAVGTTAGHGPVRYRVTAHEPGRRLEFTFDPRTGVRGTHTFTAEAAGPDSTLLRHDMVFRLFGVTRLTWPLAVRWMHDSVLEELLDNAERAVGARPARPARRSPWVRLLHSFTGVQARAVPVPVTPLLADALARVDWSDAYAVPRKRSRDAVAFVQCIRCRIPHDRRMTCTTGRFDLTRWDEEVLDEAEGAKVVRVSNSKTFEGGISGTSDAELLQALAQEGSAAYVGIERVRGEIDGRKGTFVLRHSAAGSARGGDFRVDVVPDSATGDLRGLRGELSIVKSPEGEHTYTFDYELP